MDIISAAALCITVSIMAQVLKDNGEIRTALVIICVTVIFIRAAADISSIGALVSELLEKTGLDEIYFKVLFKGLGVCYISGISADCCRDSGQSALASVIEITGRISMIVIAIPLFKAVIELVENLLS
ncbi:stage III sporulation protein AD [Ruminococcaceae bacterium FB2012]|nr:stage III sporulation protein AD [Ruminococcaceae bacterium FB2012]